MPEISGGFSPSVRGHFSGVAAWFLCVVTLCLLFKIRCVVHYWATVENLIEHIFKTVKFKKQPQKKKPTFLSHESWRKHPGLISATHKYTHTKHTYRQRERIWSCNDANDDTNTNNVNDTLQETDLPSCLFHSASIIHSDRPYRRTLCVFVNDHS